MTKWREGKGSAMTGSGLTWSAVQLELASPPSSSASSLAKRCAYMKHNKGGILALHCESPMHSALAPPE